MRYLLLIGLVALLSGCGGGNGVGAGPPGATVDGEPPTSPAPERDASLAEGPPAAWLETERGSFWLGYSSYCWGTVCADFVAPSCAERHTPKISVRRGEAVTAHLGFSPTELGLSFFLKNGRPGAGAPLKLAPSRTPSWRVDRDGAFSLFARVESGDASYVGCVEFA
jgi:hypothetical protein